MFSSLTWTLDGSKAHDFIIKLNRMFLLPSWWLSQQPSSPRRNVYVSKHSYQCACVFFTYLVLLGFRLTLVVYKKWDRQTGSGWWLRRAYGMPVPPCQDGNTPVFSFINSSHLWEIQLPIGWDEDVRLHLWPHECPRISL